MILVDSVSLEGKKKVLKYFRRLWAVVRVKAATRWNLYSTDLRYFTARRRRKYCSAKAKTDRIMRRAKADRWDNSECVMPLDFFTSGSGSASLMNWPSSFTFPNVIFLKKEKDRRWMTTTRRTNGTKPSLRLKNNVCGCVYTCVCGRIQ